MIIELEVFVIEHVSNACQNISVSYDAFRNEYFSRNVTDFTNELRKNSTRASYLRNVFPTKTFPNHHSIATGVFPEEHGVMGNELFDFELNQKLKYSFELFHYRSEIKPIWILNEMAGGVSGCMMWPGSDYLYDGINCAHNLHFNYSVSFSDRVNMVFDWILDSKLPANLIMFYVEEPDTHAHAFGPESPVITDLVAQLNNVTEYFHRKIKYHNLESRVSVIHLSDHGMDNLELRNVIDLTQIIGNNTANYYGTTPVLQVVPRNLSETTAIFEKLSAESKRLGTFKVYLDDALPERWHYQNKMRIGPITAVADLGYGFQDMFASADWYQKAYNITRTNTTKYGVHGYDNTYETMHPIFFAYGNMIKEKNEVAPFDTVDLFYLFCDILGLEYPSYLKGDRDNIVGILKQDRAERLSRWIVVGEFKISTALISSLKMNFHRLQRSRVRSFRHFRSRGRQSLQTKPIECSELPLRGRHNHTR